ncbi:kinase-like protein [Coniochaeta sp. PMI_546]|nr:kinase-like protein [Coniochaeta sp. PMI_546]
MDAFQFQPWFPRGIQHFIAAGASNYVAVFDEHTVLKFPIVPPQDEDVYTEEGRAYRRNFRQRTLKGLESEEKILTTLGHHPRIILLRHQKHEAGLLLEYMPNGSVERYLRDIDPDTSLEQRLKWARQAAEGLAYIHSKNVLHCDISLGNLLLDSDLNIKLSDFQGRLLHPDGTVLIDGGAADSTMSSMPRLDRNYCDYKTDIFALGTAIYMMMEGHPPFADLDPVDDEDEIQRRFKDGEFPALDEYWGGDVIRKCWTGGYQSATEVVQDLQKLTG